MRLAFDVAERNRSFGCIQRQRRKESHSIEKREREREWGISQKMDSESRSKKQSHPNELSEFEGRGIVRWGERAEKGQ